MTPKQLKALAKTMRENGITKLRTKDIELDLSESFTPKARKLKEPENKEIKHKIEQLDHIMKLSDSELLDRLFPLEREPQDQDEATQ